MSWVNFSIFSKVKEKLMWCKLIVETHISHLRSKVEQELNRLLGMLVDLENMYIAMNREQNPDTKKVYSHLSKVIINC